MRKILLQALVQSFVAAFLCTGLASTTAQAHHCKGAHANDPGCDGGGGGGSTSEVLYQVDVADDTGFASTAPVYNPSCDAFTQEQKGPGVSYWAIFDRHNLCATVTTSWGRELTDDIVIRVFTNAAGEITSLQLTGQDTIGKEGIFHESEVVELDLPILPSADGFTLVVDPDMVPIYKCDKHISCPKRVEIIGEIALDLMIYSPTN
jgi:hypothetical protein